MKRKALFFLTGSKEVLRYSDIYDQAIKLKAFLIWPLSKQKKERTNKQKSPQTGLIL
jgi:hypothetical protein